MRQQIALNLRDRIHGDADHDQERRAAEIEHPGRVGEDDLGQQAHQRQIDRADGGDAKIGGITPEVLSLSGRCELCPSIIRLPTWRLGYWMRRRRWARSMNTMKAITTTAMTMTASSKGVESAPWRPSSRACAIAAGSSA